MENFNIQYSTWQAVGCYSNDMADPAQLPLQDHVLNQSICFRNGGLENRNRVHDNDNVQPLTEVRKGRCQR